MPPGPAWEPMRDQMTSKIAELRAQLPRKAPRKLGERLDSCRDALQRSRAREQQAREAMELAKKAFDAAFAQSSSLESECAELQAEAAQDAIREKGGNCIQRLRLEAEKVIQEMAGSTKVSQEEVSTVLGQMSSVFQSISAISERCAVQQQPVPPDDVGMEPSAQAVGNSPPRMDPKQRRLDFSVAAMSSASVAALSA